MKTLIRTIGFYLNAINRVSAKIGAKQSFYVFCYPFKIKITPAQQKFLDTAEQFRLPLDKDEVQVYRWGKGPKKVLFVHGWRSNTFRWKRYINKLSPDDYSVYAFDGPGHGNSSGLFGNVPLFTRSIKLVDDHIGGVDHLIGHSLGGFASIYFMHAHNHKIERFASLAAPGSANDFVHFYIKTLKLNRLTEKNLRSYFVEYTGKEVEQFDIENTMTHMPADGLIIHDEGDKEVPVKYAHKMKKLWPAANLLVTQKLGHKLRDNGVVNQVLEFIQK